MQKDALLFVDTDAAIEQQTQTQAPPSVGVVGDLERSSATGATVVSLSEPALSARSNPPPFPPPCNATSQKLQFQLLPFLISDSRTQ